MKKIFSLLLLALLIASCGDRSTSKVTSKGGLNEVFAIVADRDSLVANTLREIMSTPIPMLNQYEPQFTLFVVRPQGFNRTVAEHRNLIEVKVASSFTEPSLTAEYDRTSTPQIVLTLSAPTAATAAQYLSANRADLLHILRMAERDRDIAYAARFNEKELMKLVADKFSLAIDIPKGYRMRTQSDNFIWISHERPTISQGFFIYDYPYSGSIDFDSIQLVVRRNEFAARIPGPADGSHMTTHTTDPDLYPRSEYLAINGHKWAKTSGFWEVEGDFMGGPFITFTTLNPTTGRINAVDLYLYSPDKPKRNYLRQLEHLIYTVKFPGDASE